MRVLLIGAYGFIGSACAHALIAAGHEVIGFGRSAATGRRLFPDLRWIIGDLNHMTRPADWTDALAGIDAVVNASGALQDGGGDRLDAIQGGSIAALIDACTSANLSRFVQISAPAAAPGDSSAFLATKGMADDHLRRSPLHWTILRPGLVIGRNAYGGTMLVRALAALPLATITVHGGARIQTVAIEDVADAVLHALAPDTPAHADIDLVEAKAHSLADLIARHRQWLGILPARWRCDLPDWMAAPPALIADLLGHAGWRSPLRRTAMAMIVRDVTGDAASGPRWLGRPLLSLDATLTRHPAGLQDRWQARLVLLMPAIIGALALLFLLSGIASLMQIDALAMQLDGTAVAGATGRRLGIAGGVADLLLGGAILLRRWARPAALGMAGLTIAYLLMGSLLRPDMWIDPLAPLAKAVVACVLALIAFAMLEER